MPYLSKSRFKLALECPTKLHYYRNSEYKDKLEDDTFLRSLAWGGFQVGELAKCYYPGGTEIYTRSNSEALAETESLMQQKDIILYEPAFAFENLFIRVDVLVKEGKNIKLIEVKAKSYDDSDEFLTKRGAISADWKKYLYDVAFQKYVLTQALPNHSITTYLMLVDKTKVASVDKLNQRFFIKAQDVRNVEIVAKETDDLGQPILTAEHVDPMIDKIWRGKEELLGEKLPFVEYVKKLSDYCRNEQPIWERVRRECKTCQFRLDKALEDGMKSGFHNCWQRMANLSEHDFGRPLLIDIWDYRRTDTKLGEGTYFQDQLDPEELGTNNPGSKPGLSRVDRQELQILKAREKDPPIYLDTDGLGREFELLSYPLNFIDFETSLVPIPFYIGQRPYEIIAFQFSHHTMDQDGTIAHANQWIHAQPGVFPNFEFVRALKQALSQNEGSILRYSHYENTVLCHLHDQLTGSAEPDRDELLSWIESITHRTEGSGKKKVFLWQGTRDMVDQWDFVKRFYYDPLTNGSNSLKAVLPSALARSDFLKDKYSQPIYGRDISSHNFTDHIWLRWEGDTLVSPYQQLPRIYDTWTRDELDERINPNDELDDGGAAMTAYNMMQFLEMGDRERQEIVSALLRYCELDTLAMVMVWEFWNSEMK